MGALQILLPVAAAALLSGWIVARRRWRHARLLGIGAAIAVDGWLWLVASARPLGPHPVLILVLLIVNLPLAFACVQSATGFRMLGRGSQYAQPGEDGRRDYDGYRGD